jgi:hypothetical protein
MNASLLDRFWAKVNKNGPKMPHMKTRCWLWTGYKDDEGYGGLFFGNVQQRAHRIAYFLKHGNYPSPAGLHKCDNSGCVRWGHVYEGTQLTNIGDRVKRERSAARSKHGRAKLNSKQVKELRVRYAAGEMTKTLAIEYGISTRHIAYIAGGHSWKP